jgi:putative ATP-dependent endonuclease of the OLD family
LRTDQSIRKSATDPANMPTVSGAIILRLRIERFRGISLLEWKPAAQLNVILGGGDAGKTTVLEAIGLLLSPTNPTTLADTDYYGRVIEAGFSIELDVSLPSVCDIDHQTKTSWPWRWDGVQAVVPRVDEEVPFTIPVYRLRVRGTEDLELAYEVLQPDGTADFLSVALRRSIGVVSLKGDDRNDRDLRLVQGSALERLLADKNLRSRMTNELSKSPVKEVLSDQGRAALTSLDSAFKTEKLPAGLDLALTGSPGASIASMIGLTAAVKGVQLPLSNWGAGTRRLSALVISERNQGDAPITLVDEIERGLEPYRQRLLIERLQGAKAQVFITTHSPSVIAAASEAAFWYMDSAGNLGPLDGKKIAKHRAADPNLFLSRLAIVGEGATEVGFACALLERALGCSLLRHGIHVSNGGGHEATLELLEALGDAKLRFGCFADNEDGKYAERWKAVSKAQGDLVHRWPSGCLEQNIIAAVPETRLEDLILDPRSEKTGKRLRTLADRLNIAEKDFEAVRAAAGNQFKALIIEAALGLVPAGRDAEAKAYRSDAQDWFKTEAGGRELEAKVFTLGLGAVFAFRFLTFCNAVCRAVELPDVTELV